ncbi:uncharacterized protein CLUP02_12819 [Colletotrichum lupini]|uniref:Uncharacterized protein n=1 Tax=Colletotrichum lupini TaxID=145971 RepID=A0A9Q8T1M2_9PEZI|nr:uncharacterized protein CLUP02_12819 [Colletotrichum lupini]UQC87315.1 hypothetical protein CLUP02_12819 [Colletotrichum lupini]
MQLGSIPAPIEHSPLLPHPTDRERDLQPDQERDTDITSIGGSSLALGGPQRGISRVLPQVMIPSCQGSDEPRGRLSPEKTSTAGADILLGMEAKGPRFTIEWTLESQAMIVARNSKLVPDGVRSAPAFFETS